ncbi:MAG: flagellar hook-length control protein FliK [Nitrospiraceae bacterium]|nr:flagellar hook-length control protein FliK [Nitrospiraceae bacterium]
MMDLQLPQIAFSTTPGTSGATGTQSASRPGLGGGKRESTGSGKSFSSELREVRTAKEPRHEMGRSQAERDETDVSMSSDESAPTTTASTASGATRDEQAGDKSAEPSRHDSDAVTTSPLPDVTTQSVLLALIAQPMVTTDAQAPMQTSSGEQTNIAMESVMPSVMEDGTSLPVTAADSSTSPQVARKETTDKSTDPTAALQSGASLFSTVDPKGQPIASSDQDTTLSGQTQPTAEELRNLQQEKPTVPLTREEQPQAAVKGEAQTESVVLPQDLRSQVREDLNAVKTFTSEQIQQPEDNRPVILERAIPAEQASEPKEDVVSRRLAVPSTGWQEPTQQDDERGMEWSSRDHRDRPSSDQVMVQSTMPEVSAPATPSPSTLITNGMDHRAFSSAPSAKLPDDPQPTAPTLPVQPTDWMPGTAANQTKSMVLELSQADLGRVNIRVAVNQDTVHTHFSSERNELGQYLVNGQDRLQSALNASGLDLGRFQVDIDRQSAGRSFQEPTSQGQTHGHTPQGEGRKSGSGREEAARDTTPRRGMLNLVA